MSFRMLLPPELSQERKPFALDELRPRHLRVTSQAERQHQLWVAVARSSMVNCYRALSSFERRAARNGAAVVVSRQNRFPMAAEVLLVLPPQGVASGAQPERQHLLGPAGTMHHDLFRSLHRRLRYLPADAGRRMSWNNLFRTGRTQGSQIDQARLESRDSRAETSQGEQERVWKL